MLVQVSRAGRSATRVCVWPAPQSRFRRFTKASRLEVSATTARTRKSKPPVRCTASIT